MWEAQRNGFLFLLCDTFMHIYIHFKVIFPIWLDIEIDGWVDTWNYGSNLTVDPLMLLSEGLIKEISKSSEKLIFHLLTAARYPIATYRKRKELSLLCRGGTIWGASIPTPLMFMIFLLISVDFGSAWYLQFNTCKGTYFLKKYIKSSLDCYSFHFSHVQSCCFLSQRWYIHF